MAFDVAMYHAPLFPLWDNAMASRAGLDEVGMRIATLYTRAFQLA